MSNIPPPFRPKKRVVYEIMLKSTVRTSRQTTVDNIILRMRLAWQLTNARTLIYLKNKKPTRCHLLFYCTSYRLDMFRALLCPSSGARDCNVDYHSRELLMMGIVMPETCSAYKKYNKISSGI